MSDILGVEGQLNLFQAIIFYLIAVTAFAVILIFS